MKSNKLAGRASFQLVRFILFITKVIPVKCSYAFCSFIAILGTKLRWKRKFVALDNLKIVFPDLTEKERRAIFKESLKNMLKYYIELAFIINGKFAVEKISQIATASGLEHLDRVVEREQGALLYSGHFGNFPLMMIWLAIKGYPVAAIYKEAKHFPDNFFGDIMKRFNLIV